MSDWIRDRNTTNTLLIESALLVDEQLVKGRCFAKQAPSSVRPSYFLASLLPSNDLETWGRETGSKPGGSKPGDETRGQGRNPGTDGTYPVFLITCRAFP